MATLHLVLKGKWFDKIASGEKTSEYRAVTPYWEKRLKSISLKGFCTVIFHKGYTKETIEFKIDKIEKTKEQNDLGLPEVFEIKLGKRFYYDARRWTVNVGDEVFYFDDVTDLTKPKGRAKILSFHRIGNTDVCKLDGVASVYAVSHVLVSYLDYDA